MEEGQQLAEGHLQTWHDRVRKLYQIGGVQTLVNGFPVFQLSTPFKKFYLCRTGALVMAIRHTRMTWTCKRLGRRSRLAEHMVSRWFWCVKPRLLHDMSVELVGGKDRSICSFSSGVCSASSTRREASTMEGGLVTSSLHLLGPDWVDLHLGVQHSRQFPAQRSKMAQQSAALMDQQ